MEHVGVIAFDRQSDIAFLHLGRHVQASLERAACKMGLMDEEGALDSNVIIQLLSPLLRSFDAMLGLQQQYESLRTASGMEVCFSKEGDHVPLVLSVAGGESGPRPGVYLRLFNSLVRLHFGFCRHLLKPSSLAERNATWTQLVDELSMWMRLRERRQAFLVEAVEYLELNAYVRRSCAELVSLCVSWLRQKGDSGLAHVLLVVDTKPAVIYSNRGNSQLSAEEVLLVLCLLCVCVSPQETSSFSQDVSPMELRSDSDRFDSPDEAPLDTDSEYFSPRSTPFSTPRLSRARREAGSLRTLLHTADADESSLDPHEDAFRSTRDDDAAPVCFERRIFLRAPGGGLMPCLARFIQLVRGISLIAVVEHSRSDLATQWCTCFQQVEAVATGDDRVRRGKAMQASFRGLFSLGRMLGGGVERSLSPVATAWNGLLKSGFDEWLEGSDDSARVQNALDHLQQVLSRAAGHVLVSDSEAYASLQSDVFQAMRQRVQHSLHDVANFLFTKARRNVVITFYLRSFPSLLHFVYVDRHAHRLTAPDLASDGHVSATGVLKDKVWLQLAWAQRRVSAGHVQSCHWDGDYCYCHVLRFEDSGGNLLPAPGKMATKEEWPVGVVGSDFYRRVCHGTFPYAPAESVLCHELLCVFVGAVSLPYALEQTHRLATTLWESAAERELEQHVSLK